MWRLDPGDAWRRCRRRKVAWFDGGRGRRGLATEAKLRLGDAVRRLARQAARPSAGGGEVTQPTAALGDDRDATGAA